MPRHRVIAALLVLVACVPLARPAGAQPVDPFYLQHLGLGEQAAADGRAAEAESLLKIACFGLLERPTLLGRGLVALALAEHATNDQEGFVDAFERLAEIEQRFGAYSDAELSEATRRAFEDAASRRIAADKLRRVPAFTRLADRREQLRYDKLPAKAARKRLQVRLREAPDDLGALAALGRLELDERRYRDARRHLARLVTLDPAAGEARCLLGLAQAGSGECAAAIDALASCAAASGDEETVAALLECHVELGRWTDAAAVLATLPPEREADRRIARLAQKVRRKTAAARPTPKAGQDGSTVVVAGEPAAGASSPAVESEAPGGGSEPAAVESEPPGAEPATAPRGPNGELEGLRRRLEVATTREEAEQVLAAAGALAESRPDDDEAQLLAAEAAYRASRWEVATAYFDRADSLVESRPVLQFYRSVALFESGRTRDAAEALEKALPNLARTPFVDAYIARIRSAAGGARDSGGR